MNKTYNPNLLQTHDIPIVRMYTSDHERLTYRHRPRPFIPTFIDTLERHLRENIVGLFSMGSGGKTPESS